ncbi:MAG: hypothetical protein AB7K41_10015 [Bdellovibrionales bacterium]
MKLVYALILSLMMTEAALAKGVQCRIRVSGLNVVAEGRGDEKHDAHSAAIVRCVDLRTEDYQAKNGQVSEEQYSLFIDKCSTAHCEK